MENVIKIKTENTDELVEAVMERYKNVHIAIFEHYKGTSTYIVTTKDIQQLFEFGKAYGIALAKAGKAEDGQKRKQGKATRGKGNE